MTISNRARIGALGIVAALCLVVAHEGDVARTYLDPVGIPTKCFGHTATATAADIGRPESDADCKALLYGDLLAANDVVDSCVRVPLNSNQRSAFVSLAYNVGHGKAGVKDGFCVLKNGRPSTLVMRLNSGDYGRACDELRRWVYAAGKQFRGLIARREAERELCHAQP